MKPSPIGSRVLSAYAIYSGLVHTVFAVVTLSQGSRPLIILHSVALGPLIAFFGVRVFFGYPAAIKVFAGLVIFHYLIATVANLWIIFLSLSPEISITRIIIQPLFSAGVYYWYYFLRPKTLNGFDLDGYDASQESYKIRSTRLLLWGLLTATVGGVAFGVGIAAAFGRAGNWSNHLAQLGVEILIIAGVMTIVAFLKATGEAVSERKLNWTLPIATIAAGTAVWLGWVAMNL